MLKTLCELNDNHIRYLTVYHSTAYAARDIA